jgi:protein TonB
MNTIQNSETYKLRRQSGWHLLEGLFIAIMVHGMLIGGLTALFGYIEPDVQERPYKPEGTGVIVQTWELPPHVSVQPVIQRSSINVPAIPIVVPDLTDIAPDSVSVVDEPLNNGSTGGGEVGEGWNGEGSFSGTIGTVGSGEAEREPEPFTAVEKEPVALVDPAPVYPEIAVRAGVEGTVFIKMWVSRDGSVKRAEIVKSTSSLFNEAALAAAQQWKFSPAIMNQGPVSVWVTVPFRFRLGR